MRREPFLATVPLTILLLAALKGWPRRADLRAFDSAGMAAPAAYDAEAVARLELDWWQARREAMRPRDYGRTIAEVAALTYGKSRDDPSIAASGIARAEAMAYCDARREAMADGDWAEIEGQLLRAYQLLKAGIGGP